MKYVFTAKALTDAQCLLASEVVPVKYVLAAKALFNSSSLHHLQQVWDLKTHKNKKRTV
jgi:hypothetical protein